MRFKRYHLLFVLLLTGILLHHTCQAQDNVIDSIALIEPADTIDQTDGEYDDEYESEETYEDSCNVLKQMHLIGYSRTMRRSPGENYRPIISTI
ncbi:hypothetical protein [Niabella hibiscisoli]|uniref:hypothetical protein n=1 Tax=Niabella hibiscisoli TaxID=1825928 RepID=UPI001F10CB1E|nr:hypothetical protein [Niabella hibiscisoli]MCH5716785.1 hypothetical protein [Niabella hibiscisoli]